MMKHLSAALAAMTLPLVLAVPLAAQAQSEPSYAQPEYGQADAQIRGRVTGFDGGYNLTVRDERGYIDNVQLHQGTIINPTGITLAPGMIVSILGFNEGPYFGANEIDTPYSYYSGVPYYGGHPWYYYGPSITLGFFFGNPGWWHGGYFHDGGYRWNAGVRVYNNVRFNNVYHGGAYHGRSYVAPPERGGYYRGASAVHEHGPGGYQGNHGSHRPQDNHTVYQGHVNNGGYQAQANHGNYQVQGGHRVYQVQGAHREAQAHGSNQGAHGGHEGGHGDHGGHEGDRH
jgi:hypothetical protein